MQQLVLMMHKRSSVGGLLMFVVLTSGCGEGGAAANLDIDDPLVGTWRRGGVSYCDFFANGAWSNQCGIGYGWPSEWEPLGANTYYFGITDGHDCKGEASFSNGENAVTLDFRCGAWIAAVELHRE